MTVCSREFVCASRCLQFSDLSVPGTSSWRRWETTIRLFQCRMRVAILLTDNREPFKDYTHPVPYFGPAPEALLQGLAQLPEVEVHIVSCARARVAAPEKLAPNTFFHTLHVPKIGWMRTLYFGCIQAT